MNLFAYGTLKRGFPLNSALKGTFVREAVTEPLYTLYDYHGAYPCLVGRGEAIAYLFLCETRHLKSCGNRWK